MSKSVILCVDDEKIILNSLRTQLKEKFGSKYIYEFAENARDAFELIEELVSDEYNILIIVSDWLMPEMKGDEFLIKLHKQFPEIVKVMLTGQADEAAIQKARDEANLYKCIHKPWRAEDLYDTIESGLETK
ncbi:MAG: hypothetical protein QG635_399 [Bacteroidota bacterium]|nr:hypothetical protein [Bacteroidota bacterium]